MVKKMDISLIIPAYNSEKTIDELFASILRQSFTGSVECILLDDNSSDQTITKAEKYRSSFIEKGWALHILNDGQNKKQGARRNQGIRLATGTYTMFIDADDFIHSKTLELAFTAAQTEENIDMVYFNFALYSRDKEKKFRITPRVYNSLYSNGDVLYGADCEKLLNMDPYFSVNKLYRTSFLNENNILFGEGYFYEDFEFYVHAALYAEKIKLLPNVLYYVRVHNESTTQSYSDSTIHLDSYLKAVQASYIDFHPRGYYSSYHVLKYFVHRLLLYLEKRLNVDKKTKLNYRNKGFELLKKYNKRIRYPEKYYSNLYYMIFGMKLFQSNRFDMIEKIFKVHLYNPELLRKVKVTRRTNPAFIGNRVNRFFYKPMLAINAENFQYKFTHPERQIKTISVQNEEHLSENLKDTILMLGFDYRYVGNSRYLFDYLSTIYDSSHLKFVTKDLDVPESYRIEPRSDEFYSFLDEAKVIIGESWIPLDFKFYDNQHIIQLWHGTPLKKVLYDSPEKEVVRSNKTHKTRKMFDINRWDVLISDSKIASDKFLSAYSIEMDKIKEFGYPRNNWLIQHKDDENLKKSLRAELGIPADKVVVTYLPTWRDYNFRSTTQNNGYMLDKKRFIENLDPSFDYIFLEKNHDLSKNINDDSSNTIYISSEIDIQPYLLISDVVISDYSSVIFDCLYINLPFFLLYKDYDYYKDVRGTYEDMNKDLAPCIVYSEKELAEKITTYPSILSQMDLEKYTCNSIQDSFKNITKLIENFLQ
ncbi:bifunctional glycosyltransferase/CDP-glycerol:glycerophosphate glycerophosphotransferase [Enterococcus diestrammenae]|uniref:bifunctional glycosyltransferase/CDP-glycerol:glycerophosphate glycerophosphotransferase n=1 Tax=Enterococcus diestrammenae TaxID=1155073 RepID=UPI001958DD7B